MKMPQNAMLLIAFTVSVLKFDQRRPAERIRLRKT
jgi:hypothetical protein